jgi:hypothetical protein
MKRFLRRVHILLMLLVVTSYTSASVSVPPASFGLSELTIAEQPHLYTDINNGSITSPSRLKFYAPELTATALESDVVLLTIHDRSYADKEYKICWKSNADWHILYNIILSDSGKIILRLDAARKPNTTYTYCIHAKVKGEWYSNVATASVTTPASTLAGFNFWNKLLPFNKPELAADAVNSSTAELTFLNQNSKATIYKIYRKEDGLTDSSFVSQLQSLDSGAMQVLFDESLSCNTTYTYVVHAEINGTRHHAVVSASVKTPPLSPPQFILPIVGASENAINLGIRNLIPESNVEIYRSVIGCDAYELVATIPYAEETYYRDVDLLPGVTYSYKLRTNFYGLVSEYSLERTFTTETMPGNKQHRFRKVILFPNPVVGISSLQVSDDTNNSIKVMVWNEHGNFIAKLYEGPLKGGSLNATVRASDFNTGNYILTVSMKDQVYTERFQVSD